MNFSPKIMVFRTRELIYTILLIVFVLLLILCLILMFNGYSSGSSESESAKAAASYSFAQYAPGIYQAPVTLSENGLLVEITVDSSQIQSIRLVNVTTKTTELYPLLTDAFANLTTQILSSQSLSGITSPAESRNTSQVLFQAISDAVTKARLA